MNFLTILPGELRNKIYSYALCYDSPLIIRTQGPQFHTYYYDRSTNTRKRVIENLPLVCKQVHYETLGLIYRYNDIAFEAPSEAMRTCSRFLRRAPENVLKRLRKIIVVEKRRQNATRVCERIGALLTGQKHRGVYKFCQTHPRASVVVRMDGDSFPIWIASAMLASIDAGTLELVGLVGFGLALRDEYTVLGTAQEPNKRDSVRCFQRYVEGMLWHNADRSRVLQNYRATPIAASFVDEMDDELWILAKSMFERGC